LRSPLDAALPERPGRPAKPELTRPRASEEALPYAQGQDRAFLRDRALDVIYNDEKGHVAIGAKWSRFLCAREKRDPSRTLHKLVRANFRGPLKPPFNDIACARLAMREPRAPVGRSKYLLTLTVCNQDN
jgi:uncharacterized ferritin-like protein (DUF455 family)